MYSIESNLWVDEILEILFCLAGTGVTTYALHPGAIATDLQRHSGTMNIIFAAAFPLIRLFSKTPEQGAQTNIYCAVDEKAGQETGLYYR